MRYLRLSDVTRRGTEPINIDGGIELEHSEIAEVSYPDFYKDLQKLYV